MGLSENRVYSQWNSHLIGIMISKTIGFRGTLFSDLHGRYQTCGAHLSCRFRSSNSSISLSIWVRTWWFAGIHWLAVLALTPIIWWIELWYSILLTSTYWSPNWSHLHLYNPNFYLLEPQLIPSNHDIPQWYPDTLQNSTAFCSTEASSRWESCIFRLSCDWFSSPWGKGGEAKTWAVGNAWQRALLVYNMAYRTNHKKKNL